MEINIKMIFFLQQNIMKAPPGYSLILHIFTYYVQDRNVTEIILPNSNNKPAKNTPNRVLTSHWPPSEIEPIRMNWACAHLKGATRKKHPEISWRLYEHLSWLTPIVCVICSVD